MAGLLGYVLIVGIDETLKAKVRVALPGATAEVFLEKSTKGAYTSCCSRMPDAILLDWQVFPAEETTVFLQKLRKHRGGSAVAVVFLAGKVTAQTLAVAAEYDVFQIVTDLGAPQRMKNLMRAVSTEAIVPATFQEKLEALQAAIARGEETTFARLAEELYRQFPDVPLARFEYANLCLRCGRLDEARDLAKKALAHNPHNLRASNILARAHLLSNEFDKALVVLKAAEATSPRNLERLVMMGDTFVALRQPPEARRAYETALKVDPSSSEAASGLVATEMADGDLNEALAMLRGAQSRAEQASLFNTAGVIAARQKDLPHAKSLYETAISFLDTPDLKARVQFNVGLAYERMGRLTEAVAAHQKALEYLPNYGKSRARLEALAGSHVPTPALALADSEALDFDTLGSDEADPLAIRQPSLIDMVSDEKVLKPFPVQVLQEKKK